MKKVLLLLSVIILSACSSQEGAIKEASKVVYKYDDAKYHVNDKAAIKYVYDQKTYKEATRSIKEKALSYEDMKFKAYPLDDKNDKIAMFVEFKWPASASGSVQNFYLVRKKGDEYKIDLEESRKINWRDIDVQYKGYCINQECIGQKNKEVIK
ncbi:hypothetical protein [Bacillus mycoides]|uniref:hypothetical protein n=1 Tax=Bacillus mycoides TaxID=1405 RepID=UPI0010BF50E1|nr:hypothetical protein [Bacillus mycoides]TKI39102.1 hypothetical protein FC700_21840 [Bacillus mycoides]